MIFSTIHHHVKAFALVKQCIKLQNAVQKKLYHQVPFTELYEKNTGQQIPEEQLNILKKKHPNIDKLSNEQLQCTLQILVKFQISTLEACKDPHVFIMHPITMENYGEILKECGFVKILPNHIIRYHTLVKSRTLHQLKSEGLVEPALKLQERLLKYFKDWPESRNVTHTFDDSNTSIIRMYILEKYLNWKLNITSEDFQKYCRNYLPLKHKPMLDIQEAISLAQDELKLDVETIRRNGFIISADPVHTRLILDKVPTLAGLDIREAIKTEPAILKNNCYSLLQIKNIFQDNGISEEAQRKCLKVFCMRADTIRERLDELKTQKEYQVLSSNPRVLALVVHQRKMLKRLNKIHEVKKQCFSLNQLVSSSKVFNNYISSFGNKVCGRDIAILICNSLRCPPLCDVTAAHRDDVTDNPTAHREDAADKRTAHREDAADKRTAHRDDVTDSPSAHRDDVTDSPTAHRHDVTDNRTAHRDDVFDTRTAHRYDVTNNPTAHRDDVKFVLSQLRRHKYWLHAALHVVDGNIQLLKKWFSDDVIFNNCQLLLYPLAEAISYLEFLLRMRDSDSNHQVSVPLDTSYNNIDYRHLTDQHILSLFLYEMEKKYHFTGDGIWSKHDVNRIDVQSS